MDIKKLTYFVTIVEEGNISAASKKLHIAQPPLSNQLKILEEELGIKLMERGARNITLTEGGKLLYKRAKNIIELTETTKKELEDFENGEKGIFSLGTVSSSGAILLSRRVIKFHKDYPRISFNIHEGNTYELLELLTAGIIEMAIVRTPFKMDKVNGIFLDEEPMIAVMRKDLDWDSDKLEIKLKSLENKPVILYRRLKSLIVSSCNKEGFEPTIFCENDDARTTLMWAQAGLGIALIPKSIFNIINDENMIYKIINDKDLNTKIGAIWMKNRYLSSIAKSFIKVFKE
ncbi:LysR family transcriptional regulator [Clostridium sp. SHJSY1]|uniref:LysR family transcriptional regulator n=1 Tax=Clostridium sp. SHJSY1 TaxID=2942483 RepID=UPI0028759396|nr:LysR family transcriptional regulator [Clostridium sp. SHJSY1]MDS0526451.1 LysR family transcriptional regulator [Clostridium sp. SHJSY1]